MATETRIYLCAPTTQAGNEPDRRRLVRATHQAAVSRHLARDWSIVIPSQDELIALGAKGITVEVAAADNGNASTN